MRKTALLPLALLLLVIIICTIFVGYFESNSNFKKRDIAKLQKKNLLTIKNIDRFPEVIHSQEKNIEKADNSLNIYYSLVEAKKQIANGNIEKSENILKTVLVFYPENVEALSLLGGIYYVTGRYKNAEKVLENVVLISPNKYSTLENLGLVYEKQKKYNKALNEFINASLMNPNSALSLLHIAGINSILGNKRMAMENFIRAYDLLGDKIFPFTFDPAYDNIRDMPLFIKIMNKITSDKKETNQ